MSLSTFVSGRKRQASQQVVVSGGLTGILQGIFGIGSPQAGLAEESDVVTTGIYHFHPGDLFTPGAQNWVFDPPFDTPTNTQWGHGWLNGRVNYLAPYGQPLLISNPNLLTVGTAGPIAGQIIFQPLTVRTEEVPTAPAAYIIPGE